MGSRLVSIIAAISALTAIPAAAAPIVIGDQLDVAATFRMNDYGSYSSPTFANQVRNGRHWGDSIQSAADPFNTTQITVTRRNDLNRIEFDILTWFDGSSVAGSNTARYADLFIDTATPGLNSFNLAVALGYQTKSVGLYNVATTRNANDIWSSNNSAIYGGYTQFKTTSPFYSATMAATPPVRLATGSLVPGYSVAVTRTSVGSMYNMNVAITSTTNLNLFDNFDVFWATADCSNDAIWGQVATVPAPSGILLLGLGLLGMGILRRRPVGL